MADSAVVVTAGTGTNIDTRTEATNGHHRQVVVLGDPATNAGVAPVDATAGLKVDLGADNDVVVSATNLDIRDLTNADVVTAELSSVDNAVLDAIEADTTTIAGDTTSIDGKIPALGQALAAASVPVILPSATITTLTPPAAITGFGTAANQTTIIGHLDGVEGLLTTIDGDTGTIATEVAGLLTDTELRATPVPVSGTVTVTATNLDVQSGGADLATTTQAGAIQTAVELLDDTVYTDDTSTHATGTSKGLGIMAVANPTDAAVDANDIGMVAMTTARALKNDLTTIAGTAAVNGSGNATGALRVELANNGTGVLATVGAVTAITNALPTGTNVIGKVSIDQTTPGTTNLVALTAETTKVLGVTRTADGAGNLLTSNSTTYTAKFGLDGNLLGTLGTAFSTAGKVDVKGADGDVFVRQATATNLKTQAESYQGGTAVGSGNPLQVTLANTAANSTPVTVQDLPVTSGGLSKFHLVGAATDNATNVKASAGQVYTITAFNVASTPAYLKFHNTSGTPTAGAGVTDTYLIPGNTAGGGVVININKGIAFSTGIGITLVTGIADSNTTAIAASNVVVNIYYK